MGEARQQALRVGFDSVIQVEFHGAKVSSDAGLFPFRDLDEAVQLTESGAASPGTNRLSEHPACGSCLNPPSFDGPLSMSQLSFPGKRRYIQGSGDRHRRREKVIWEMSVETSMLRQGMLCGNHNKNPGATQGIVTSLLLLALLALRGGVLYGRTHEICV
jgi:hypothetical protein